MAADPIGGTPPTWSGLAPGTIGTVPGFSATLPVGIAGGFTPDVTPPGTISGSQTFSGTGPELLRSPLIAVNIATGNPINLTLCPAVIEGVTIPPLGGMILVANQSVPIQNGLWSPQAAGSKTSGSVPQGSSTVVSGLSPTRLYAFECANCRAVGLNGTANNFGFVQPYADGTIVVISGDRAGTYGYYALTIYNRAVTFEVGRGVAPGLMVRSLGDGTTWQCSVGGVINTDVLTWVKLSGVDSIGNAPPSYAGAAAVPVPSSIPAWDSGTADVVPGTSPAFDLLPAAPKLATDPGFTTDLAYPIGTPSPFNPAPPGTILPPDYWSPLPPGYIPVAGMPQPVTVKGVSVTVGGEEVTVKM